MAPRLKVFVTSDGLTDYVVAVGSRPKALAAWGAHQDLFKTGGARETNNPDLVKAALSKPGEVLRRPADSKGALSAITKAKPATPKGPSKAALSKVEKLKQDLASLAERRGDAEARLKAEREAMESRAEREAARFDAEARRLEEALERAREAL